MRASGSNALLAKAFLPEVKVTVDAACCAGVTPQSGDVGQEELDACIRPDNAPDVLDQVPQDDALTVAVIPPLNQRIGRVFKLALQPGHVVVLDPHSNVATALINNIYVVQPDKLIQEAIDAIGAENLLLCYPDEGAAKRYSELMEAEYILRLISFPLNESIPYSSQFSMFTWHICMARSAFSWRKVYACADCRRYAERFCGRCSWHQRSPGHCACGV